MRNKKNVTVTFETFVRKTKLKDRMAAGFWYRMYELSGVKFEDWFEGKRTTRLLTRQS